MTEKILTISVAAYNMEPYIRQTLDSLLVPEILDKLEVFVVDDGGQDRTLEIAKEYENKYPGTFHAVHKENGGYGSTVNYGIAHATGKYFKLLDGDDWFNSLNLEKLIILLEQIDTDIVVTPFYRCTVDGHMEKINTVNNLKLNVDIQICKMKTNRVLGMWAMVYKTDCLRTSGVQLPLHCLYTDQIYSTVPFATAKTIRFVDLSIYCYRIGRDGQSVSKESRIKHVQDNIEVTDILCKFYQEQKDRQNENLSYIVYRTAAYCGYIIKTYLLQPISPAVLQNVAEYDCKLKELSPDIYCTLGNVFSFKKITLYLCLLRLSNYGKLGLKILSIFLKDGIKN